MLGQAKQQMFNLRPLGGAEGRERIRDIHTYILILDLTKALQGGV